MARLLRDVTGELLTSIEGSVDRYIRINAIYGDGRHIKLSNFEALIQLLGNSTLEVCPRVDKLGLAIERAYPELEITFDL